MTAWDEAWTERGDLRAHWRPLMGILSSLGRMGFGARLKEDFGLGLDRHYDPIPFPLPAHELCRLEEGLGQRARLLEALLEDVGGAQTAVSSGALPPAFVARDPCPILGQVSGVQAYGADLVRCPDGEWRVLADRIGAAALVETPALAAFLPGICRVLLGQSLRLASIPALWLGDPGATRVVAAGYRRWSLRDACDPAGAPVVLAGLSREERLTLQERLDAAPWRFVGCMHVPPSVAPSLGRGGLEPMPIVLRLALRRDGAAWQMGPGGVARAIAPGASARFKHIWIADEARAERPQRVGVSVCLPLEPMAAE